MQTLFRILQITKLILLTSWESSEFLNQRLTEKEKAKLFKNRLEKLGSVFIKFGQFLSMRPELIPDAYCKELFCLLEDATSFSTKLAKEIFQEEFNCTVEEAFLEFDEKPIAAASFGQVYKAKTHNGEKVAIKFRRPKIKKTLKKDLKIIRTIAWLMAKTRIFSHAHSMSIDFSEWVLNELDYVQEVKNTDIFKKEIYHPEYLIIPKVYKEWSGDKIITTEFIEGISFNKIVNTNKNSKTDVKNFINKAGHTRRSLIKLLFKVFSRQFFIDNTFHADPHPANIILTPDGRIGCIDFGVIGNIDKKSAALVLRNIHFSLQGEYEKSFQAFYSSIDTSKVKNIHNLQTAWIKEMQDQLKSQKHKDSKNNIARQYYGKWTLKGILIAEKHGASVPEKYLRIMRAISMIESLCFYTDHTVKASDMTNKWRQFWYARIISEMPRLTKDINPEKIMRRLLNMTENAIMESY